MLFYVIFVRTIYATQGMILLKVEALPRLRFMLCVLYTYTNLYLNSLILL